MTVAEVYDLAIAFLPEEYSDNPDLRNFSYKWANVLVQECFEIENSIRRYYEEDELTEAPVFTAVTDEIPYHDELVRAAFPHGMATYAFIDDDDDYRANIERTLYQSRANEKMKYTVEKITDVY